MPNHKQTDAADAAPDVLQQVAADVATARAKARHSVFGIAPVVTYAALEIVDEEEEEYEEEKAALAGLAVVEGRAATVASCAACCVVSQRILRLEIAAATQRYKQLHTVGTDWNGVVAD
jgi:hypothetical protein